MLYRVYYLEHETYKLVYADFMFVQDVVNWKVLYGNNIMCTEVIT